jgi:hypothetical protein
MFWLKTGKIVQKEGKANVKIFGKKVKPMSMRGE